MKCRCGGAQCSHLHGVVWRLFDEMVLASCSTAAAAGVSELPWPGCALVRRAGRHMRTVPRAVPVHPRKGREANQPSIWVDRSWMIRDRSRGPMVAFLLISHQHPGKGNALLRFRYFFCSAGICSAVTRSTGPPSCAPTRGCHLEASKEEKL